MASQERSEPSSALPAHADLRAILGQSPHAIVILDHAGIIEMGNARAEALLDSPAAALHGTPFPQHVSAEATERVALALRASHGQGEGPADLRLPLVAGGRVDATFLPLGDGRRTLMLLRAREEEPDVDERKLTDLGKLLAGVAHELRTPLTYVSNTIEHQRALLEEMRTAPDPTRQLQDALRANSVAHEGVNRVVRIVQALRPLSKNRPPRPVRIDLADLAMEAVRTFRATDGGKTRVTLDLQATHEVLLDRDEMLNVLLNLLNNAADAMGRSGSIQVVTRNQSRPPEICVVDSGPGVPTSFEPQLFEPFQTTKTEGTGLGLFISRRAVEAHGGTLTYQPTPGGGATFVVRFPSHAPSH